MGIPAQVLVVAMAVEELRRSGKKPSRIRVGRQLWKDLLQAGPPHVDLATDGTWECIGFPLLEDGSLRPTEIKLTDPIAYRPTVR
jgi:hypothetical protein